MPEAERDSRCTCDPDEPLVNEHCPLHGWVCLWRAETGATICGHPGVPLRYNHAGMDRATVRCGPHASAALQEMATARTEAELRERQRRETMADCAVYGWTEVARRAREELVRLTDKSTTDEERRLLGLPVYMEWMDSEGSMASALAVLARIAVDPDGCRWAVTDEGMALSTKSEGFMMRPATAAELKKMDA